jgi:tRNA1Val (adenine37-N6)-methyltransferase
MAPSRDFTFKQFVISQGNAAMKVGTDGVLLGAWVNAGAQKTVLDIGTGTGVIALMIAQRSESQITAIEIEKGAFDDASVNVLNSPWSNRIDLQHISVQDFAKQALTKFDLIVSNPPFFTEDIKSSDCFRQMARHTNSLPFDELLSCVAQLLTQGGRFSVIIPFRAGNTFRMTAAQFRLFPTRLTSVKPKPSKPAIRLLIELGHEGVLEVEDELIIETETHHVYTPEFIDLVKGFYLNIG